MQPRAAIVDLNADASRTALVCGAHRSGTTWAASMVNHDGRSRLLFEPFNSEQVTLTRHFRRMLYVAPEDPAPEYADAADAIMTGRVRERWIDQFTAPGRYVQRLIKDANCQLFLGWLIRRYPGSRFALVVRHPLATALSESALPNLLGPGAPRDLLAQDRLCDTHLATRLALVESVAPGLETRVLMWAVQLHVALADTEPGAVHIAFYESLRDEPEHGVAALLGALGGDVPRRGALDTLRAAWATPSPTTRPASPVRASGGRNEWRQAFDASEQRRARAILDAFGLDAVYAGGVRPDRGALEALLAR